MDPGRFLGRHRLEHHDWLSSALVEADRNGLDRAMTSDDRTYLGLCVDGPAKGNMLISRRPVHLEPTHPPFPVIDLKSIESGLGVPVDGLATAYRYMELTFKGLESRWAHGFWYSERVKCEEREIYVLSALVSMAERQVRSRDD